MRIIPLIAAFLPLSSFAQHIRTSRADTLVNQGIVAHEFSMKYADAVHIEISKIAGVGAPSAEIQIMRIPGRWEVYKILNLVDVNGAQSFIFNSIELPPFEYRVLLTSNSRTLLYQVQSHRLFR
jgi:hypothetical protein